MTIQTSARFLTIEGVEGVGKTTNIQFITAKLEHAGIDFIVTREPGGTAVAELIRKILLTSHEEAVCEMTELLLIFAARAQHIHHVIKPALARGQWVVCDRFTDATYAYQGGGRGLNTTVISQLETLVQGSLRPDMTLILDLAPEIGLERARQRGALDRFEQEQVAFFNRVRDTYLARAKADPGRCAIVNAAATLDQVQIAIMQHLEKLL